jgi:hypothetical protein
VPEVEEGEKEGINGTDSWAREARREKEAAESLKKLMDRESGANVGVVLPMKVSWCSVADEGEL